MDLSDEDLFPLSDNDETREASTSRNPVEEHLLDRMYDTIERVETAKSNADRVKSMTEKILKKLYWRVTRGEDSGSDTDSDSYQITGEPVAKKKRTQQSVPLPLLEVVDIWQKVIDDKWIAGVVLKNTSNRILKDPCLYVIVKEQPEVRGIASFWEIGNTLSVRTDELAPEIHKLVATVVLDLPNFANNDYFEAFGTISYILDDKNFQTPVPLFRLGVNDVIDKNYAPKFTDNTENAVLAIKSISAEHELVISLEKEGDAGRLFEFLKDNGFKNFEDEMADVYVAKNNEFFRHCIFEILPCTETGAPVRVSAPSSRRLEVIVRLLRDKIPDIDVRESDYRIMEAARALERELHLQLTGDDVGALHMARIVTDLLIP